MIVVDENLHDQRIMQALATWYRGKVISVTQLRPGSVIKDEAIPTLLLRVTHPTFVTINTSDFWKKARPHPGYCLVAVDLPKERSHEVPDRLRRLFQTPAFRTKAARNGEDRSPRFGAHRVLRSRATDLRPPLAWLSSGRRTKE